MPALERIVRNEGFSERLSAPPPSAKFLADGGSLLETGTGGECGFFGGRPAMASFLSLVTARSTPTMTGVPKVKNAGWQRALRENRGDRGHFVRVAECHFGALERILFSRLEMAIVG